MHFLNCHILALAAFMTSADAHVRNGHAQHKRQIYGGFPVNASSAVTSSSSAVGPITETIFSTATLTFTSCAPTVTDCPADATSTSLTSFAVSTTVHTAASTPSLGFSLSFASASSSEAAAVSIGGSNSSSLIVLPLSTGASSSSVVMPVGTGFSPAPYPTASLNSGAAPTGTGFSSSLVAPVSTGALPTSNATLTTVTEDSTLTYTLGFGSSTTVVTTTIHRQSTVYETETVRATSSSVAAAPTNTTDVPITGNTHRTSISTVTSYITVYPATPSSTVAGAIGTSVEAVPSSSNSAVPGTSAAGDCLAAAAVTVTAHETIYITSTPSTSSVASAVLPIQSSPAAFYPTSSAAVKGVAASTGFLTRSSSASSGFAVGPATGSGVAVSAQHPVPSSYSPPSYYGSGYGRRK